MLISKNSPGLFSLRFNVKKKKKSRIPKSTTAVVVAQNFKTSDVIKSYFTSETQSPNKFNQTLVDQSESTCSRH